MSIKIKAQDFISFFFVQAKARDPVLSRGPPVVNHWYESPDLFYIITSNSSIKIQLFYKMPTTKTIKLNMYIFAQTKYTLILGTVYITEWSQLKKIEIYCVA